MLSTCNASPAGPLRPQAYNPQQTPGATVRKNRTLRVSSAVAAAIVAGAAVTGAQPAYQASDVGAPVTFHWDDWVGTNEIVQANGLLFFFQNDGSSGRELWRSDGTALGTYMLRDLCPGSCGSRSWFRGPIAAVGDVVFFAANDGVHGIELWVTDGTALGTRMVVDIVPGWESSYPSVLTEAAGQLFFLVDGGVWRSDGTPKGTYRLFPVDVVFNALTTIMEGPGLLYVCDGNVGGVGLWRSDGTHAGTFQLAEVGCYDAWFSPDRTWAQLPNGDLLFAASNGVHGFEPWRTDGTVAGTSMLLDLDPGGYGSDPAQFARIGSEILFNAYSAPESHLWRTDGTPAGTQIVPLPAGTLAYRYPRQFAAGEQVYYFGAQDTTHGREPWYFDGQTAQRLADVIPGPPSSLSEDIFNSGFFAAIDENLVFFADDGVHGGEIWRSDGTEPGTYRLSDGAPGPESMAIVMWDGTHRPSVVGDFLYYFEQESSDGYRFSRTDGTTVGPETIRSIDNQSSAFVPIARDRGSLLESGLGRTCFEPVGSSLFFEAPGGEGLFPSFWQSHGSAAGPELALEGTSQSQLVLSCIGRSDRLLYFEQTDGGGELRSLPATGGPAETVLPGSYVPTVPPFLDLGVPVAFATTDGLYVSDGTNLGTALVASASDAGWLAVWQDQVLFSGSALRITQAGNTDPIYLTGGTALVQANELATLDDSVVFVGEAPGEGPELWRSGGNAGDATLLLDIVPGERGGMAGAAGFDRLMDGQSPKVATAGAVVVASATHPAYGRELWVTDASPEGTHLLKDIFPGDYPSTPRNLTRFGDRVFFTAESELEGLELWATDGTYDGTVLVKDIAPGGASSIPDDLVVRDGTLYFSAWSPNYGREAWKSDGTTAGTIRITDIAPGPKSSSPQRFARAGNRLYMSATDHVHGYELWAISDDGGIPLFLDGFESEDTSRWDDTFQE